MAPGGGVEPGAAHAFVADLDDPGLDPGDAHHLQRVLRLRAGQALTVSDGVGRWRRCRFTGVAGRLLEVAGPVRVVARRAPEVTVAFAPGKGDRPEWAVQKLTELGVDRIVLLTASRSVVKWTGDRAVSHVERLRRVAREAAMQSRRAWLPVVEEVAGFDAVASRPGAVLAVPGGDPPSLDRPVVLVGPEGGWAPAEVERELPTVGLGELILRTETAAVAAGTLLVSLRAGIVGPA